MNNFIYITPEEIKKKHPDFKETLEKLREIASLPIVDCENDCGEKAWKLARVGLCFTCTTGEADASGDYELYIPETIHVGDEDKIDLAVISTDDEDEEDGSIPM